MAHGKDIVALSPRTGIQATTLHSRTETTDRGTFWQGDSLLENSCRVGGIGNHDLQAQSAINWSDHCYKYLVLIARIYYTIWLQKCNAFTMQSNQSDGIQLFINTTNWMTLLFIEVGYPQCSKVANQRSGIIGRGHGVHCNNTKLKVHPLQKFRIPLSPGPFSMHLKHETLTFMICK